MNETRLRAPVAELETLLGKDGTLALKLPEYAEIIKKHLGVTVSEFRFSPQSVEQVLASVRAQLLDRLATHRDLRASELDECSDDEHNL